MTQSVRILSILLILLLIGNWSLLACDDQYFGQSTLTSGSIQNPNNATGSILSAGSTLNNSNAVQISGSAVLTILLGHYISPGTEVTISLARATNGGNASIDDNSGTIINFSSGPLNRAQHIIFTVQSITDRIILSSNSGATRIDGLTYTISDCDSDGIEDSIDLDSDNDGIYNTIECEVFCRGISIVNTSFDEPFVAAGRFRLVPEADMPGWNTTDPTGVIEVWGTGHSGVPSYEGTQHAELNANNPSTLSQDICASPGTTFEWSVAHRGRSGTDVANVLIGEDLSSAVVQLTMTTDNTDWVVYSGIYTVPPGQLTTVIAFEAVSSANGRLSVGNLLDAVTVDQINVGCLDTDNDGVPNFLDLDSDNDGILDAIEAGHGLALDAEGRIAGAQTGSGENGLYDPLETGPESGLINYPVSDSEDVPDGNYDAYELDSDDDGCYDTIETQSSDDDDNDGIFGVGTPAVDTDNGLITTHTYGTPILIDRWQDAAINHCEICTQVFTNPHIRYNRRG